MMEIKKLVALTFLLSFVSTISSSSDESEALLLMSMMIKNQVSTQTQPITQRQEHLAKTLATLQKREQLEKNHHPHQFCTTTFLTNAFL